MTIKKDFSYLDTKYSNKRYYAIMAVAFVAMMSMLLIGATWLHNPILWIDSFIAFCIGMIVLIHYLGGIKPRDILSYQSWCQDEFKKTKEEKKNK